MILNNLIFGTVIKYMMTIKLSDTLSESKPIIAVKIENKLF